MSNQFLPEVLGEVAGEIYKDDFLVPLLLKNNQGQVAEKQPLGILYKKDVLKDTLNVFF